MNFRSISLPGLCARFVAAAAFLGPAAGAWAQHAVFDSRGFNRNREFYSEMPFEHVDPLNGNLLLTFTDLVLPGNAGFDLRIQRTYNSKIYASPGQIRNEDSWAGIGWTLHMGRVLNSSNSNPLGINPVIEMPDGSLHPTYVNVNNPNTFITRDFWVFTRNTEPQTLKLPNGVVYEFGNPAVGTFPNDWRYATRIVDPFGNDIAITYRTSAPLDGIQKIDQHVGTRTRTITFGVSTGVTAELTTMSFNSKTWNYVQNPANVVDPNRTFLMDARPPVCARTGACASWRFAYPTSNYFELTKLTTPSGGTITYAYQEVPFTLVGSTTVIPSRVVASRVTRLVDNGAVEGTWTYDYGSVNGDSTKVTGPCNITRYFHYGVGNNNPTGGAAWKVGLLKMKTISDLADQKMEQEDFNWRTPAFADAISQDDEVIGPNNNSEIYVPLVSSRTVSRYNTNPQATITWTTTNTYNASSTGHPFNDYGRPHQVVENGQLSRTTTRTFQYGFTPYIVDRVGAETVTAGGQSYTRSSAYNLANGLLNSSTVYGITTSFTPSDDGRGNVKEIKDGNQKKTTFGYDYGLASSIRTPEFLVTRVISADGTITSEKRRGFTTSYGYDNLLRSTSITPPAGITGTNFTYDNTTGLTATRSRGSSSITTNVDGFGRPTLVTNAVAEKVHTAYNACGQLTYQSHPFTGVVGGGTDRGVGSSYDALDRVIQRTNADGSHVDFAYSNGIDVAVTEAVAADSSRTTKQNWSAFGDPRGDARLVSVTEPEHVDSNAVTSYGYNGLGQLASVTQGTTIRTWTYVSGTDRLATESHPESGLTTYVQYDNAGNLLKKNEAGHGDVTFTYDGNNRLIGVNYPGAADDLAFDYDDSDNRILAANGSVTSNMAYDSNNRLDWRQDIVGGQKLLTDYSYDGSDNLTLITYPSGSRVAYTYGSENRISGITNGGSTTYANTFAYHPSGGLQSFKAGGTFTHSITYDPNRYWINQTQSPAITVSYTHDFVGNPTHITDSRLGVMDLGYDNVDRLKTVITTGLWGAMSFNYDNLGNRTSSVLGSGTTSYGYQSSTNRLTSITPPTGPVLSLGWDNAGNMTADGVPNRTYTYTALNMVREVKDGTTTIASYRYDADNQRAIKRTGTHTSLFVHGPGGQLLSEMEQDGGGPLVLKRDYVYAGARLLAAVRPPVLKVLPTMLLFAGAAGGAAPPAQTLDVSEAAGGTLAWTVTDNGDWLNVTPAGGTAPAVHTITATASTTGKVVGLYPADIAVSATGASGSPAHIPAYLVVTDGPGLAVQPSALTFHMNEGDLSPAPRNVLIASSGAQAGWTATASDNWIAVGAPSGTTPSTLAISVDGTNAHAGTQQGWVRIDSALPGSPKYVPVALVVHPAAGIECTDGAWFCEPFDELSTGDLGGQGAWAFEPDTLSAQVTEDPRGTGNVLAVRPPPGQQVNNLAVFATPAPSIDGNEIALQVMTLDVPDNSKQVAKIQFFTQPGQGWGKTGKEFGALRFGTELTFQYGPTVAQVLVPRLESGRWYEVRLTYQQNQVEAFVDGQRVFSGANFVSGALPVKEFSTTGWSFPGVGHLDLLQSRPLPSGLVVEPASLNFHAVAGSLQARAEPQRTPAVTPGPIKATSLPVPRLAGLPLSFEPNRGQLDPSVKYLTRGPGYSCRSLRPA